MTDGSPPASGRRLPAVPTSRPVVRRRATRLPAAGRVLLAAGIIAVGAAVAVVGIRTARTVAQATVVQDRLAASLRPRYEAIPFLTQADESQLRRSLNDRHVALARSLGVSPPATRAARDSLAAGLVGLAGRDDIVITPASFSAAALTTDASVALDSLTAAFARAADAAGVPRARPTLTSAFRSAEDQAALRAVNANAAAGTSSHEYATTFDLAYRRYDVVAPAPPPAPWRRGTPVPVRRAVDAWLAARWAQSVAVLAADYPSRYDALLGRTLVGLEDRGVLVVIRERRQPVYHVTVARRLATASAR